MNSIETLFRQTEDAYNWLNGLLDGIPFNRWERTPRELNTNMVWQVGHLTIGIYYHSVMSTKGHHLEVTEEIPLRDYNYWFTRASPSEVVGKLDVKKLRNQLSLVHNISLKTIKKLSEKELDQSLEKLQPPHPIARTKYGALDWNIKHTMWHCGQLAMLKRIIDQQ